MYFQVPIEIIQMEDGLWRAEAPSLQGCWVDAPTMKHALAEMPQVIAMVLDLDLEKGLVHSRASVEGGETAHTLLSAVRPRGV